MNEPKTSPKSASAEPCCDWKQRVDDLAASATKMARDEPGKALGYAFVTGLLCTVLPVGRLLGGIVRLALALVPPALLVLGGMKAWEEIEKRTDK
jgi:hypothetical protein